MAPTRFPVADGDHTVAINAIADELHQFDVPALISQTAGAATLTAAQVVGTVLEISGQTSTMALTTPTAAALVAACVNPQVGLCVDTLVVNKNTSTGTVTWVAGSGVTLVNNGTLAVSKVTSIVWRLTNVTAGAEAVTAYFTSGAGS